MSGNARSPAYGTLNDYQFMRRHTSNEKRLEKAREAWGAELSTVAEVVTVFANHAAGNFAVKNSLWRSM